MSAVLDIDQLTVQVAAADGRTLRIAHDVSLAVRPGEVVALIGGSGAGKTTVALAALGYFRGDMHAVGGHVTLSGLDALDQASRVRGRLRGLHAAYVAQSAAAALNPSMTLGTQLAEPLVLHRGLSWRAARTRAAGLMKGLRLPGDVMAGRYPHQASGGQLQRAMIAMAMSCDPDLLVFDEPTTALDATTQIEVLKAIKETVRGSRTAALYVSHDLAVVAQLADRIVVMRDGVIVEAAPTVELLSAPRHAYTRELLRAAAGVTAPVRTPIAPAAELLAATAISTGYEQPPFWRAPDPRRFVLHDISLAVRQGEVVAIVGESGSGKSTFARVVAGLHPPLRGSLRFHGRTLPARVRRRPLATLRGIQIIFQSAELSLNPQRRVGDMLARVLALYRLRGGPARRQRVVELLESVGLSAEHADRLPGELSGGQRQRVSIARALAAEPELVICDEILASLDTVVARQVLDLLRELRARLGLAYLLVSHDLSVVADIADRIAVFYRGELVELGSVAQVFAAGHHPYTDRLLACVPQLRQGWLEEVPAEVEAAAETGTGCAFFARCRDRIPGLCELRPVPIQLGTDGHSVLCHRPLEELRARQQGGP